MSNEDNQDSTTETVEKTETVETAKADAKENATKAISNIIATLKELQENNPKVLYGGIGGVVIILLFMMMSGGDSKPNLPSNNAASNLKVGQQYVLRSANTYEQDSTVRLVSTPGNMAAYDDTEKEDREGCKHLAQGTPVILKEIYGAYGNPTAFVKVTPTAGECKDSIGWTSSNNIQQR